MHPDPAQDSALRAWLTIQADPHLLANPANTTPRLTDERGIYSGTCIAHMRPANTAQVVEIVEFARAYGYVIVAQGGNTSSCGAATPTRPNTLLLSFERMAAIAPVDVTRQTIEVGAGAVLADVQAAAASAGWYFPLSLGAEGSCTIGGNVATNAGGVHVVRYGNMRQLVAGLEAVLADGSVISNLPALRKDNTGYDLQNLMVGSEGTLGVITRIGLKLSPALPQRGVALIGLADADAVMRLFNALSAIATHHLQLFELMPQPLVAATGGAQSAFDAPWAVLIELASGEQGVDFPGMIGDALAQAELEPDVAVLASSEEQCAQLRRVREAVVPAQNAFGASLKHDIAVPLDRIPAFLAAGEAAAQRVVPGCRPLPFGHVGDGNLHYNISQPAGMDVADFRAKTSDMQVAIFDVVVAHGGTISAEHGIGQRQRELLPRYKSAASLAAMHRIKHAFDPAGIMNPDKVLAS